MKVGDLVIDRYDSWDSWSGFAIVLDIGNVYFNSNRVRLYSLRYNRKFWVSPERCCVVSSVDRVLKKLSS